MAGCDAEGKAHATIAIGQEGLLKEIDNLAWVEADLMPTDDEHAKHQLRDIVQDGNKARVLRVLDLAHKDVVSALYPFTRTPVHTADVGNPWREPLAKRREWRMELIVPTQFSQTSLDYITLLTREYMCCRAMADWLSIAYPTDLGRKAVWQEKAEAALDKIRSEKSKVCNPSRRRRGMSWA